MRKYGNQNFLQVFSSKDGLGLEFIACWGKVMQDGALASFTLHDPYGARDSRKITYATN